MFKKKLIEHLLEKIENKNELLSKYKFMKQQNKFL